MKIAYISSPFLSDCDLPLLRELVVKGYEVTYFLLVSPSAQQAAMVNIPIMEPTAGLIPAKDYSSLDHLNDYFPIDNIYIVNMPIAHDWHYTSMKAIWQLYRYILHNSFDIVHITNPLRYGAFLLYTFRQKMVLTVHDPLPHSSDRNKLNTFHRWTAFRLLKHFIVLSESLRGEFIDKYNLTKKSVYTTGLSIYDPLLSVKPATMTLPKRYILFVGSINPHKGIRYLCEAMREVNKENKEVSLVIAGRGTFDFDINAYCSEQPIQVINRFVSDSELVTLISGAICVVCPYIDATQSGVIMSSFALNKPVIATNVGALPEMFTHGKHGLLIPPRDSIALAQAIVYMLGDGRKEEMAINIAEEFSKGTRSWASIAEKTTEIYHNVTKM